MGFSDVILSTLHTTATLEVYYTLQQLNVVNLYEVANCCVRNYTPVEIHDLRITLA